jgi:phosphatidylglycerophosphate synthase
MTSGVSETRPAAAPPLPTVGTAAVVLLATTAAEGGGPAALQLWGGVTILERLLDQLARLGAGEVHVVTRPEWEPDLEAGHARVHVSAGPADDLRAIAEIAHDGGGDVLLAHADLITHDSALANLMAKPRRVTAALCARTAAAGRFAPRVRERRGQVVSAGSAYHSVRRPTGGFLGACRITAADRPAVARITEHLAGLQPPSAWEAQLDRKRTRWRQSLGEATADLRTEAARQDVVSLVLCGMVRGRVEVASVHLKRLFWARPLSAEAVAHAEERIGRYDEDRLVLDSAVKTNDAFFTTFFVSPYSRFIARWAARRGFTPNQVTTFSMLLGLVAAAAFATGERWAMVAGAVVLQASFTADCVDGQLARYTRTFSMLGAWLDSVFDRAKEYAVFAGLAIGAAASGDDVWLLAACAMALQTIRHMIFVGYRDARAQRVHETVHPPIEQPSDRLGAGDALDDEHDDEAEQPEPEPAGPVRRPLPRRVLAFWQRLGGLPAVDWVRKTIALPIGERFLVISVTAALFTPRTTFTVLLVWGGVAAVYTFAGRILRSLAAAPATPSGRLGAIALYRDDGPVAAALGRRLGRSVPVQELALTVVGVAPGLALIAFGGDGVSDAAAGAAIAWAVLCGGVASGSPPGGPLRWATLPILRAFEYAALLWLAALAGGSALPAAFALLAALAFRHYDLVYRMRLRGTAPPAWLGALGLGWDGRLLAGFVLLVASAVTAGFYAAAVVFGVAFAGEAIALWARSGSRGEVPDVEEDEEPEEAAA